MSETEQGTAATEARPPRDILLRASRSGCELRSADAGGDPAEGPLMFGHFAVFNEWTEINSMFEGNFLERISPGAFKKTFRDQREEMRVLFQHGFDYQIGDKPLGPIQELREDDEGAYYEVPLLDAGYVRDEIMPGLEAGLYGASFRFRVMREEFVEEPGVSDDNPQGLPERTIKEMLVREFGPVTFPAYPSATAGVRSLTDEFIVGRFAQEPERLRELADYLSKRQGNDLPSRQEQDTKDDEVPRTTPGPSPTSSAGLTPLFPSGGRKETHPWKL